MRPGTTARNMAEQLCENIDESLFDEDIEEAGTSEIVGNETDGWSFTVIEDGRVIKVTHQDVTGQVTHVPAAKPDRETTETGEGHEEFMARVFPDGLPKMACGPDVTFEEWQNDPRNPFRGM